MIVRVAVEVIRQYIPKDKSFRDAREYSRRATQLANHSVEHDPLSSALPFAKWRDPSIHTDVRVTF